MLIAPSSNLGLCLPVCNQLWLSNVSNPLVSQIVQKWVYLQSADTLLCSGTMTAMIIMKRLNGIFYNWKETQKCCLAFSLSSHRCLLSLGKGALPCYCCFLVWVRVIFLSLYIIPTPIPLFPFFYRVQWARLLVCQECQDERLSPGNSVDNQLSFVASQKSTYWIQLLFIGLFWQILMCL